MCRHLAYLGPPVTLREAIIDPPYGLYRQAWAPRMMRNSGTMNVDGFGVGWYAGGEPIPARYRRQGPIWADPSFADLTRVTRSGALLAAVRDASAGTEPGASACSPFGADHWLFSHNGALVGWPETAAGLAASLTPLELLDLDARVDSALLWALTLKQLRRGAAPGEALAAVIGLLDIAQVSGRFNFLLTDGSSIAATAAGHTLWYRQTAGSSRSNGAGRTGAADSVVVASEPADEEPGWIEVPDRSLLTATAADRPRPVAAHSPGGRRRRRRAGPARKFPRRNGRQQHPPRKGPALMTTPLSVERRLPDGFLASSLRADARAGLASVPKSLPPKWFYDAAGSELFEKITGLPEYYPTRAEREILQAAGGQIAALSGAGTLVELGSGSSEKTRLLIDALRAAGTLGTYVPVDVSEPALRAAATALLAEYPGLEVRAVVSDFEEHLGLPSRDRSGGPRLVAFLGSTIGNLLPPQRAAFLARIRASLAEGDSLLLGTDLAKDPAVLLAAYDDAAGVTAAFNKNVLAVLNTELGADFDLDAFEHVAVWDAEQEWIEMRLRSAVAQTVHLPAIDLVAEFADGEEMRTEVSAKFRREGVTAELAAAGLALREWWTDREGRFGLSLSVPA